MGTTLNYSDPVKLYNLLSLFKLRDSFGLYYPYGFSESVSTIQYKEICVTQN